jgi:hypothetical protein
MFSGLVLAMSKVVARRAARREPVAAGSVRCESHVSFLVDVDAASFGDFQRRRERRSRGGELDARANRSSKPSTEGGAVL